MKQENKKIRTTFTINPDIVNILNEQHIRNHSKLIEWLLLNHFKEVDMDVKNIIL
jgi:hypothetical protein